MAVAARPKPGFDFIPAIVGTGAGLAAGVLRTYATGLPAWRMGVYSAALIGAGVAGHLLDFNADLSYGLQIAGTYGLAEQVAPAIKGGKASLVLSDVSAAAPARSHAARAAATNSHAGCSACAAAALRNPERAPAAAPHQSRGYVPGQLQAPGPGPVYPAPKQEAIGIL